MRVPWRTSAFSRTPLHRAPVYRTPLAVVAWIGMLLHLGASVCGTLGCAAGINASGMGCCASGQATKATRTVTPGMTNEAEDAQSPAHTVKRAPCGCCDTEVSCTVAPLGPIMETAPSRTAPPPPAVAVTVQPPALPHVPCQRVATLPWQARPPPVLPLPTKTIVLLI